MEENTITNIYMYRNEPHQDEPILAESMNLCHLTNKMSKYKLVGKLSKKDNYGEYFKTRHAIEIKIIGSSTDLRQFDELWYWLKTNKRWMDHLQATKLQLAVQRKNMFWKKLRPLNVNTIIYMEHFLMRTALKFLPLCHSVNISTNCSCLGPLDKSLHKTLHSHTSYNTTDVRHLKTVYWQCGIKMTFSSMSVHMYVHVYTCVHMVMYMYLK